jgi:hypothetical protein
MTEKKEKTETVYELQVEAKISEAVKEALTKGKSDDVVYVSSEAMNDVFGKALLYDGGGGGEEGLPYHDFKYCASESAEAANSSFCISFSNAVSGFKQKRTFS